LHKAFAPPGVLRSLHIQRYIPRDFVQIRAQTFRSDRANAFPRGHKGVVQALLSVLRRAGNAVAKSLDARAIFGLAFPDGALVPGTE